MTSNYMNVLAGQLEMIATSMYGMEQVAAELEMEIKPDFILARKDLQYALEKIKKLILTT